LSGRGYVLIPAALTASRVSNDDLLIDELCR